MSCCLNICLFLLLPLYVLYSRDIQRYTSLSASSSFILYFVCFMYMYIAIRPMYILKKTLIVTRTAVSSSARFVLFFFIYSFSIFSSSSSSLLFFLPCSVIPSPIPRAYSARIVRSGKALNVVSRYPNRVHGWT